MLLIWELSCVTSGNLQEILRSPVVNGGNGSEIWNGHIPYEMGCPKVAKNFLPSGNLLHSY